MANATITVLEADGVTSTDVVVLDVGRQAAAASKSLALSTEDKSKLDEIAASLALIDNSIASGNELQVDVVAALPAGTNNIGDVDIASITAGDNVIGRVKITDGTNVVTIKDSAASGSDMGFVVHLHPDSVNANGRAAASSSAPVAFSNEDLARISTRFVTVSMSANADAVDVGDVVAATQIVAACTPGNDVPGILQSVCLIDVADQKAILRLVFFSANTTLGTEDAAPDIDDTEALTVLGHVDIAVADYVDYGGASVANIKNIGLPVAPAAGTDDIYMAIYTPATSTPNYGGADITVRLGFI